MEIPMIMPLDLFQYGEKTVTLHPSRSDIGRSSPRIITS